MGNVPKLNWPNLRPFCLACLKRSLSSDYGAFRSRAVVIEPVAGAPVYVFQSLPGWQSAFGKSQMVSYVEALLSQMQPQCQHCGSDARFIWIDSERLTSDMFSEVADKGLNATLLQGSSRPVALCATCCVERIVHALETRGLSYISKCAHPSVKHRESCCRWRIERRSCTRILRTNPRPVFGSTRPLRRVTPYRK